ncbi:MAG TPA: hypothetical protein VFU21_29890 [Kofleriaceae bacterium]|nr:hypothetical protein [Kofleriaceae bacterium]
MKTTFWYPLTFMILASAGCGGGEVDDEEMSEDPVRVISMREPVTFTSLEDMVLSSDLVIEGHVVASKPGELRGEGPDGLGGVQFAETTVKVHRVLAGAVAGESVTVESMGWTSVGRPIEFRDGSSHHVHGAGERAIFHLVKTRRSDDRVVYRLTSSQGKFLVAPDGALRATRAGDRLVEEVAALPAVEVERRITGAAAARQIGRRDPVY